VVYATVHSFYIAGGVLVVWALLVSAIGVFVPEFPGSKGTARLVGAISIVLVVAAIGTAIYDAATEEEDGEGPPDSAALVLPF
jgi:hypothetical protein